MHPQAGGLPYLAKSIIHIASCYPFWSITLSNSCCIALYCNCQRTKSKLLAARVAFQLQVGGLQIWSRARVRDTLRSQVRQPMVAPPRTQAPQFLGPILHLKSHISWLSKQPCPENVRNLSGIRNHVQKS